MVHLTFLALVIGVGVHAQAGAPGRVEIQEISRSRTTAAGQPIELPGRHVEVIASLYTIPPGAALPVHKHPRPRYAYVLSGRVRVTEENGRVFTYAAGEFIVEMVDQWHHGSNPSQEPARLLVIDQVEAGSSNTVLREQ